MMELKHIFAISLLCLGMASCSPENENSYQKGEDIRITFHLNGGTLKVNNKFSTGDISIKVNEDYFFSNRFIPNKDDMQFSNWYLDTNLTKPLDFDSYEVGGDIDLYARWIEPYYNYQIDINGDVGIALNKLGIEQEVITIPKYIDGYQVTGILDYGFSYSKATKLYIPNYIETIGFASFYDSNLEYIELSKNIVNIEHGAFIGTNNIKELKIEKNDKYLVYNMTLIEKLNEEKCEIHSFFNSDQIDIGRTYYSENIKLVSIAPYSYYGRKNLRSIQLPYGITTIGDYAFADSGIVKFYMNDELTTIGNYAFAESYLNEIVIYAPLESIGDYCFRNTMITSFTIPASVTHIGDGALQAGVLNEIIVKKSEKYTVVDSNLVEILQDGNYGLVCFSINHKVNDYYLDEKIVKINSGSFYSLDGVDNLYFTNIQEVEQFIFMNLDITQSIYFESDAVNVSPYAFFEERRNLCFSFNAHLINNSSWHNYFDDNNLLDYINPIYNEK